MRLKSFQAKSMQEALRQVKDTLGDDAIIVSTREEKSGWVRITAAVEQISPAAEPAHEAQEDRLPVRAAATKGGKTAAASPPPPAAEAAYDEDETLSIITDVLLKHRVPGNVSDRILSAAGMLSAADPRKTLARALEKTFRFETVRTGNSPLLLVGPPGAGKTLMAAKLAAQAVMAGQRPAVITTDIARAGGVEQLTAFLDILELPLLQAEDAASLQRALKQAGSASPVIVDTGGLNPFDPQEMKYLAKLMSAAEMTPALVMPAGLDAEESAEMAMTFEILGVKKLIPTRLDFARRFGGILSAADRAGLVFGNASHTPQVANGILDMTPQRLSELLMPHLPPPEGAGQAPHPAKGRKG